MVEIIDLSKVIRTGENFHIMTSIVPLVRHGDGAGKFDPPCEGYAANLMVLSDHCSTHMDAPFHFIRNGDTIDKLPVSRMMGPAVVCDLSHVDGDQIEKHHLLEALDNSTPAVRSGGFILLKTRGEDGTGKGLGRSAAEHLVGMNITLVGTDNGNIDTGYNRDWPSHMVLLGNGVLIGENLTNLDRLLGREFLFIALPLALDGGTGSPVRPIAIYPYIDVPWPALNVTMENLT